MPKFNIFPGQDGQYYWRLVAPNGEILCVSEGYTSKYGAQNGVAACKRYAPAAHVVES